MNIQKGAVISFSILAMILLLCGIMQIIRLNQVTFNGSRVRNPDEYYLEFTRMNSEDSHKIQLSAGDSLQVDFDIEKGHVDLLVGIENEDPVFRGNDIDQSSFALEITKDGLYTVSVKARGAKGMIDVKAE